MAKNIEIKARIDNREELVGRLQQIADRGPILLEQEDQFFPVSQGRLKLRIINQSQAQLISYYRPDRPEARASDYEIYETNNPNLLRSTLARVLGEGPVVRKSRQLFLCGRTRIHVDSVESLGEFVEIEVVLHPSEDESEGRKVLEQLMQSLEIPQENLVPVAYADLLDQTNQRELYG